MDRAAIFDVHGPYAHFRKNYSPASPVTFPCPTPTSVLGLLGGIAGFEKREYLKRFALGRYAIAIRIMAPVEKFRSGINLINTKLDPKTFRPKGKSPRIQIPFEFLRDPHFRIYFWHETKETYQPIVQQLERGTTVFTPSLGLAQCIAEVEYQGEYEPRILEADATLEIHSVIPLNETIKLDFENNKKYQRFTVPVEMQPGRVVTKYQQAIIEEHGHTIRASGCRAYMCNEDVIVFFEGNQAMLAS